MTSVVISAIFTYKKGVTKMNHSEVFDRVLANHGETYAGYGKKKGHAKNFYYELYKKRSTVPGDTYIENLSDFGARVYADNGRVRIPIDGALRELERVPIWSALVMLRAVGYSMVVTDGDREYVIDSGECEGYGEREKANKRKEGPAEGVDADLHGEVSV